LQFHYKIHNIKIRSLDSYKALLLIHCQQGSSLKSIQFDHGGQALITSTFTGSPVLRKGSSGSEDFYDFWSLR